MKRIKMILAMVVAAVVIGSAGASPANAGTLDGTISISAGGVTVGPCDFAATTTGTPPAASAIVGSSFTGAGSTQPCDPSELGISNISVSFSGSYVATLGAFGVTADMDTIFGTTTCTFPFPAGITLTSPFLRGPYEGGGGSNGSNCFGLTAAIAFSNVVFS